MVIENPWTEQHTMEQEISSSCGSRPGPGNWEMKSERQLWYDYDMVFSTCWLWPLISPLLEYGHQRRNNLPYPVHSWWPCMNIDLQLDRAIVVVIRIQTSCLPGTAKRTPSWYLYPILYPADPRIPRFLFRPLLVLFSLAPYHSKQCFQTKYRSRPTNCERARISLCSAYQSTRFLSLTSRVFQWHSEGLKRYGKCWYRWSCSKSLQSPNPLNSVSLTIFYLTNPGTASGLAYKMLKTNLEMFLPEGGYRVTRHATCCKHMYSST